MRNGNESITTINMSRSSATATIPHSIHRTLHLHRLHHHHHHPLLQEAPSEQDAYDFNRARSTESTENVHARTGKTRKEATNAASAVAASSAVAATSRGVATKNNTHNTNEYGSDCGSYCCQEEGRGVPVSPKKMPPTPPRDHGSPFAAARSSPRVSNTARTTTRRPPSFVEQPFLSDEGFTTGTNRNHTNTATTTASVGTGAASTETGTLASSGVLPPSFLRPSLWRHKRKDHGDSSRKQHNTTKNSNSNNNNNTENRNRPFYETIFRSTPSPSDFFSRGGDGDAFYTIHRSLAFDDESDEDNESDTDGSSNNSNNNSIANQFRVEIEIDCDGDYNGRMGCF